MDLSGIETVAEPVSTYRYTILYTDGHQSGFDVEGTMREIIEGTEVIKKIDGVLGVVMSPIGEPLPMPEPLATPPASADGDGKEQES